MWLYFLLVLVALLAIKLVNLCLFWSNRDLPYESFLNSLCRLFISSRQKSVLDLVRENAKKYGKVYGSYRGLKPVLVVSDLEIAKEVLIKQFSHFFKRTFETNSGDPLWDNSLTHLPYEQWKSVRTVMGHTFTSSKMRGMIPKVDKVAKRFANKLTEISKSKDNELELKKFLYGYSMDSIVAISFGIDINNIENPENDFVKISSKLFKPSISLLIFFLFPSLFKYVPFVEFPPRAVVDFFGNISQQILIEKRKNLDEVIKNGTGDILDLHLIAQREDPKNHLTDDVLASQAFLFFIGGIDMTSLSLQLCTYFLTINPDAQERVYLEIKHIMGERTEIQYEDVQKMKFLEACLLESVRLVPISFSLDRIASEDVDVCGLKIEKGMVVEFPLGVIHNDPTYFPEPEKFIPDRFLKDGDITSDTAAFLTFGDGPKGCIGRRLALMMMQTLLANILLKVRLDQCSQTPIPLKLNPGFDFTNLFAKPLTVRLTPHE